MRAVTGCFTWEIMLQLSPVKGVASTKGLGDGLKIAADVGQGQTMVALQI